MRQLLWHHNNQLWWCRALWVHWYIYSVFTGKHLGKTSNEFIPRQWKDKTKGLYQACDTFQCHYPTKGQNAINVISIFKSIDFKIKITTNLKEVDFLELLKLVSAIFLFFLVDKCFSSLFQTKFIEKKFNLQLVFLPIVSWTFTLAWATMGCPPS